VKFELTPAVLAGDADALEGLDALARALYHLDVDPKGIAGGRNSGILAPTLAICSLLSVSMIVVMARFPSSTLLLAAR